MSKRTEQPGDEAKQEQAAPTATADETAKADRAAIQDAPVTAPEADAADDAPEATATAADQPETAEADKPVWDVSTHGPVSDEFRGQYRVVGE